MTRVSSSSGLPCSVGPSGGQRRVGNAKWEPTLPEIQEHSILRQGTATGPGQRPGSTGGQGGAQPARPVDSMQANPRLAEVCQASSGQSGAVSGADQIEHAASEQNGSQARNGARGKGRFGASPHGVRGFFLTRQLRTKLNAFRLSSQGGAKAPGSWSHFLLKHCQRCAKAQEGILRGILTKHTTMTREQIDKLIDDPLSAALSNIQAALDSYGKDNPPQRHAANRSTTPSENATFSEAGEADIRAALEDLFDEVAGMTPERRDQAIEGALSGARGPIRDALDKYGKDGDSQPRQRESSRRGAKQTNHVNADPLSKAQSRIQATLEDLLKDHSTLTNERIDEVIGDAFANAQPHIQAALDKGEEGHLPHQSSAEIPELGLRNLLKKTTNMTDKEINALLGDIMSDAQSRVQAALDKHGKGNLPSELVRELMDAVKQWISTMVQIADWSSVLRASAAR